MQSLVTTDDLRLRAFGLMMFLEPVLPPERIEAVLNDLCLEPVLAAFEEDLETYFETKVIRQSEPAEGDVYDLTENPLDYHRGQFVKGTLWRWRMKRRPVISVQRFQFRFSRDLPILDIPLDWVRVDERPGTVTLNPIGHSAVLAAQYGAFFLPLIQGEMPATDLPQFTVIDYTAGVYDPDDEALPNYSRMVKAAILDAAYARLLRQSLRILPTGSDLDGFRQQFASIENEVKDLDAQEIKFKNWWADHFRGLRSVVI